MERIAILDHDRHRLYVEYIPDEIIDAPEWCGEEDYIERNYAVNNYSWDFIIEAVYFLAQVPYGITGWIPKEIPNEFIMNFKQKRRSNDKEL